MDVGVGMMQVEVTNRCNLNCPHCFYYEAGEKGEDYNNFLNLKAMDKLLNDLGIRYIKNIEFHWRRTIIKYRRDYLFITSNSEK